MQESSEIYAVVSFFGKKEEDPEGKKTDRHRQILNKDEQGEEESF